MASKDFSDNIQNGNGVRKAKSHVRRPSEGHALVADSLPGFGRKGLSPLERQWSTSNVTSTGGLVQGFGTSAEDPSTAAKMGNTSFLSPDFQASWNSSFVVGDFARACSEPHDRMDGSAGFDFGSTSPLTQRPSLVSRTNSTEARLQSFRGLSVQLQSEEPFISSMIHDAARITNWRSVLALCKTHPEAAKYAGRDGLTSLHHACGRRCPYADVVEALIKAYPDALLEEEEKGWTPLHYACRFKAPEDVVRLLLYLYPERGRAIVTHLDRKGRTPLYYAVRYEAPLEVPHMLLQLDPSAVLEEDRSAESPIYLLWDSWAEKLDGKRMLYPFLENVHPVQEGDSTDAPNSVEQTHLQRLEEQSKLLKRWKTVNFFLRAAFGFPLVDEDKLNAKGVDSRKTDANGSDAHAKVDRVWRILHVAAAIKCHHTLFLFACALCPEQALEFDEDDLYGPSESGKVSHQTALHLAASSTANGEVGRSVIQTLLEMNPNAAQVADGLSGKLPLHRVAENGRKVHWTNDGARDVYQAFPRAAQIADILGRLPLHCAAAVITSTQSHDTTATDNLLLSVRSAICNLVEAFPQAAAHADVFGCLPLHIIAKEGQTWDGQVEAVYDAHQAAVRARAGSEMLNRLPIHLAAANHFAKKSLVERLVELHPRGARQADASGKLPLHLACESGKQWNEGVQAIYQAFPVAITQSETNPRGWSPLHMAAACPTADVCLIGNLVELHPESSRIPDAFGRFPLHLACRSGKTWEGGLRALFDANPEALGQTDNFGRFPLFIAAQRCCPLNYDDEQGEKKLRVVTKSRLAHSSSTASEQVSPKDEKDAARLDILYHLLRADPTVLPIPIS